MTACEPDGFPEAGAPDRHFVGRDACRGCHAVETAAWEESHHDLALDVAADSTVLGNFDDAYFTQHGITHRLFTRDGTPWMETQGLDGILHEYPVTHVIGVEPLQQYLTPFPGGHLQTLPLTWDTRSVEEGGQRWFHIYGDEYIGPDDPLFWAGLEQNFNYQCAECHVTEIRKGYDLSEGVFNTGWQEIDVSCEACHGPASLHVTRAESAAASTSPYTASLDDFPVSLGPGNPGAWYWDETAGKPLRTQPTGETDQIDACARCHSRRGLETEDYTYGQSIVDTHRPSLPRAPLYHHDGQIREEVYVWGSFLQSRMYAAGVLCSDCHDPHSNALLAPGPGVCARCHAPVVYDGPQHDRHPRPEEAPPNVPTAEGRGWRDGAAPTCLDCHMQEQTYMVVDPRGDHSFRIPRPALSPVTGAPNVCTDCHEDRSDAWAAESLLQWYGAEGAHAEPGYGPAFALAARRGPTWPQALAAVVDDPANPNIIRAAAVENLAEAHPIHLAPRLPALARDADPLVRRSTMQVSVILPSPDRVRVAGPGLTDPVRGVRAAAARALVGPGVPLPPELRSAFEEARQEWIDGQFALAESPRTHVNLGGFHAEEGRIAEAERSLRQALLMDPTLVSAWVNLSDLQRGMGREEEAMSTLVEGIRTVSGPGSPTPQAAPLVHARGLAHVRAGRSAEALFDLALAVELDPGNARYAYVHAVALLERESPAAGAAALDRALTSHPRDPELLTLAVNVHASRGDRQTALELARRLLESDPEDPGYGALVRQLGGVG